MSVCLPAEQEQYKCDGPRLAYNNVLCIVWAVFFFFFSLFCPFYRRQDENRATDCSEDRQLKVNTISPSSSIVNPEPRKYKNMKINMSDSKSFSFNWRPALILHSDSFIKQRVAVLVTHTRTHLSCQVGLTETSHRPCLASSLGQTRCLWQPHQPHSWRQRDRLRRGGSIFLLLRSWNQAEAGHYTTAGDDLTEIIKRHRRRNYINSHSVPRYEKKKN